jgi:phosphopantothenoylcysteine decarboxylase/phosphopantothenate--cysteine ligase
MHPAEEIRGKKSSKLLHKRIVLGITGSIAAVESVRLARELIRHGADVYPIMTPAATRIIHPDALEFATSHPAVT